MKYLIILLSVIFLSSCNSSRLSEIPLSQFVGNWKLVDRGILENIEIEITKDENGKFSGAIKKLNDDKYVNMFMSVEDKIVIGIKRNSNFEFVLSERKIAAPLFSTYGQNTSSLFSATFESTDVILLGNNGSEGKYIRVK